MCKMNQYYEDNYLINKGTYGGRANQRSINLVIIRATQVEISTITRRILVQFNNNTIAFFDRIIHHILCLCQQSYQMPVNFTALLGNLLCYIKYGTKTANGISKEAYRHSTKSPVYRLGQGSTLSGTGWGKLFSKALDLHNNQRFGSTYSNLERTFKQ